MSSLTIISRDGGVRQVDIPPNATVRFGEREIFIPAGQHKMVSWDGDYVVVPRGRRRLSRRERLRSRLHALVDRWLP